MGDIASLGSIVRRIRLTNGWTLVEMSQRTGIPLSTLSKVEHNRLTLTYDKLLQMSARLDMRLSDLLNLADTRPPVSGTARRSVGKFEQALHINTENYDYHYLCTELRTKLMIPIFCRVRARSREQFGDLVRHRGEEFVYVVAGSIEVHTEFYDPVELSVGDSHYLDSEMPHAYLVGKGCDEAFVISVCASREDGLQQELMEHARAKMAQEDDAVTDIPGGRDEAQKKSRRKKRKSPRGFAADRGRAGKKSRSN